MAKKAKTLAKARLVMLNLESEAQAKLQLQELRLHKQQANNMLQDQQPNVSKQD